MQCYRFKGENMLNKRLAVSISIVVIFSFAIQIIINKQLFDMIYVLILGTTLLKIRSLN